MSMFYDYFYFNSPREKVRRDTCWIIHTMEAMFSQINAECKSKKIDAIMQTFCNHCNTHFCPFVSIRDCCYNCEQHSRKLHGKKYTE